jgi:hypothetical protein
MRGAVHLFASQGDRQGHAPPERDPGGRPAIALK